MMAKYRDYDYINDHRSHRSDWVRDMRKRAKECRFKSFESNCVGIYEVAKLLGYTVNNPIQRDDKIAWYRSTFGGRKCLYFVRNNICHIWVKSDL